jgi:hypothetical protein
MRPGGISAIPLRCPPTYTAPSCSIWRIHRSISKGRDTMATKARPVSRASSPTRRTNLQTLERARAAREGRGPDREPPRPEDGGRRVRRRERPRSGAAVGARQLRRGGDEAEASVPVKDDPSSASRPGLANAPRALPRGSRAGSRHMCQRDARSWAPHHLGRRDDAERTVGFRVRDRPGECITASKLEQMRFYSPATHRARMGNYRRCML